MVNLNTSVNLFNKIKISIDVFVSFIFLKVQSKHLFNFITEVILRILLVKMMASVQQLYIAI